MRAFAVLLSSLLGIASANAATLAGATLPDHATVAGRTLVLNGLGLREATALMVDVYVAGLYLPSKTSDPAAILTADVEKRLVMSFVRALGKQRLVEAWTEGFEKNQGGKKAAVAPGLAALNAAMADVKKGESIVLTFTPGAGTVVTVKGADVATIPGDDFQGVLFAIWLGPTPPNAGLRDGLLGRTSR